MEFMLDHLQEISRTFFTKKFQPVVDVIDASIEALKKEVVDLEDDFGKEMCRENPMHVCRYCILYPLRHGLPFPNNVEF